MNSNLMEYMKAQAEKTEDKSSLQSALLHEVREIQSRIPIPQPGRKPF